MVIKMKNYTSIIARISKDKYSLFEHYVTCKQYDLDIQEKEKLAEQIFIRIKEKLGNRKVTAEELSAMEHANEWLRNARKEASSGCSYHTKGLFETIVIHEMGWEAAKKTILEITKTCNFPIMSFTMFDDSILILQIAQNGEVLYTHTIGDLQELVEFGLYKSQIDSTIITSLFHINPQNDNIVLFLSTNDPLLAEEAFHRSFPDAYISD